MIPQNVSVHPVSQLVAQTIADSNLNLPGFVRSLGYVNVNKGLRNLDRLLHGTTSDPWLLRRIREVYGRHEEFEQAFREAARLDRERREAVARERERLAREYFLPHIRVLTIQHRPNSISAFAFVSAFSGHDERYIDLPESFFALTEADRLVEVQDVVRKHHLNTNHNGQAGETHHFGAITGYVYVHHYGQSTRLAVDGTVLGGGNEEGHAGVASVTIRNKTVVREGQRTEIRSTPKGNK